MTFGMRDLGDIDALVTDRYLDSLLAGRPADEGSESPARRRLDAAVRLASRRLVHDLPRFHPSFRFEERLAIRLAEAAAAMRLPAAAGAEGSRLHAPVPLPELPVDFDPFADPIDDALAARAVPRPLLVGGAMAASALSLAGAFVAWRRTRPASPMARAARAAHALRERPLHGGA